MYRLVAVLSLALVVACSPRGQLTIWPQAEGIGVNRTVFVGTTRVIDPDTGTFGPDRLRNDTGFARYDVSIPPDRELGEIAWPRRGQKPDPRTEFLTTKSVVYDGAPTFRADLSRAMGMDRRGSREVTVFVHGFNNSFAEGLYRVAQLSNDLQLSGVTVHYAWPSLARPLGYVYDRDSALFARDGLEELLAEVAAAGADRILLVGHSMGSAVTMETLRQMAIRGDRNVLRRLSGVILLSPDVDVDVFHAQASGIGPLPQPFIIFSSRKDKALALSARLTGQRERLGNLRDLQEVADLDVTVVDVAAFSSGSGHFTVGNSPALLTLLTGIPAVNQAFDSDRAVRPDLLTGTVLTLQNATQIVLSPVAGIAEELSK